MMKKFNIKKVEAELLAINTACKINTTVAIQLIVNNLHLYNQIYNAYKAGDTSKVYLLYQLNGQIFKQLKEFKIMPSASKEEETDEFQNFLENLRRPK